MRLYLLRHGEAEPNAVTDQARKLTAGGRDDVQQVVERVAQELQDVSLLLASPYARAQQTADIVCDVIFPAKREASGELIPDTALSDFFAMLQQRDEHSVLLVSHQPLVGRAVAQLCGHSTAEYSMGTANLARIDCDYPAPGCGTFRWIQRPAH